MFSPLADSPSLDDEEGGGGDARPPPRRADPSSSAGGSGSAASSAYVQMRNEEEDDGDDSTTASAGSSNNVVSPANALSAVQTSSTGLELSSLRSAGGGGDSKGRSSRTPLAASSSDGNLSGSLISSEHPSEALHHSDISEHASAAAAAPSPRTASRSRAQPVGFWEQARAHLEHVGIRLRHMLMEDASDTTHEEIEMMDYDNPEDHVLERKLDEDHLTAAQQPPPGNRPPRRSGFIGWLQSCGRNIASRNWRKYKLTALRMLITFLIGVVIGLTGFAVSKSVSAMIRANVNIIEDMMTKDRPAAAFFTILIISCIYTGVAALFVTFGSWQTRGSGVGRLNAYLSGMSSSRFLALKALLVKIGGLILTISAGIKQGMEGPFIHIGAMIGLHVSRFFIGICNLFGGRCGMMKYTSIVAGVVDERMFISSGAAAGFSVAFNAPVAGVLYVQDGAFAYWQGEYTLRTFLCTMTAVTTLNLCFKQGEELPSRGLIDVDFARTSIVLREFWGFFVLGIVGGILGIIFTKINVAAEKFRHKYLQKLRLPNVLDVLACTVLTVLLSFILPFMLGCHQRWSEDSCDIPTRCIQFQCGPHKYSDLASLFFTIPEQCIRILFDRHTGAEAHIPYQVLIVFFIFYFLMASVSYGMATPGGLFIPAIIIGASYGRLVGLAVQSILESNTAAGETVPLIIPGVYAVLGAAALLGGITRMTLPITVMMLEITSDAQFLIPIMLVVLLGKVVADFGTAPLYAQHLKLDGLVMVFGDKPPSAVKKLTAADIMSKHTIRKLDVIESVEKAWSMVRDTKHNAFPVTDSLLGTLKSIIQKRKLSASAASADSLRKRSIGSAAAKRSDNDEYKHDGALTRGAVQASALSVSTQGTGVFLGLIQRRHLIYVLTSMPCFPTSNAARDSEPMTALPYELQLAQYNQVQQVRRARAGSRKESRGDTTTAGGASGSSERATNASGGPSAGVEGLEVVPLNQGSSLGASPSSATSISDAASPPPLVRPQPTVSHALMHASADGAPLLNDEGASTSASFVEWCARQANNVGDDLTKVAAGDTTVVPHLAGQGLPLPTAAMSAPVRPTSPRLAVERPPIPLSPSASHERLTSLVQSAGRATSAEREPINGASVSPPLPRHTPPRSNARLPPYTSTSPSPPGSSLTIHPSMLSHFVNLSPFIDQGAYTVSESMSARRVWALFRSLGMRHIVVLNHAHQPVGVITKKDLVKFAIAD